MGEERHRQLLYYYTSFKAKVSLLKELAGVRFAILVLWGPVTEAGPFPGFQDLQHYMHCSGPACPASPSYVPSQLQLAHPKVLFPSNVHHRHPLLSSTRSRCFSTSEVIPHPLDMMQTHNERAIYSSPVSSHPIDFLNSRLIESKTSAPASFRPSSIADK
jgi:hypothetical protein